MKSGTYCEGLTLEQQEQIVTIADANNVWYTKLPSSLKVKHIQFDIDVKEGCGLFNHDCNVPKEELIKVTPEEFVKQFMEHFNVVNTKKEQLTKLEAQVERLRKEIEMEELTSKILTTDLTGFGTPLFGTGHVALSGGLTITLPDGKSSKGRAIYVNSHFVDIHVEEHGLSTFIWFTKKR